MTTSSDDKLKQIIALATELLGEPKGKAENPQKKQAIKTTTPVQDPELDYDTGDRAFFKEHGKGLSGPKRIVLVAAYLVKGEAGKEIGFADIKAQWNKAAAHLGGKKLYAGTFALRAKDNGWIKDVKREYVCLTKKWSEIFLK